MSFEHVAVVLAAGGSRRLGRPKQLLTRDGETLVHRAARLAAMTKPRRLLVVTGAHAPAIESALADLRATAPLECVHNARWNEGLSSSLRLAAHALRDGTEPVLVLACDQPALAFDHLDALLRGAASSPSHCAATLHAGRPGVPAVIAPTLLASASRLQGDRGFGAALATLHGVWTLHAPALAHDLDTPKDVADAVSRGWLDR
ncbi:nucleotidyltransferase family protein [Lysobacter panacisoli]|uniref:Nucleotidyltransferase family protein n=1 Tax=Lysobacter panacisoli TaxID=1255263 RepID=A0ABP9L2C7_9GAMM|nr:nucleotidyltransferase family protein [Lysobacter panacisoli]